MSLQKRTFVLQEVAHPRLCKDGSQGGVSSSEGVPIRGRVDIPFEQGRAG